jgi:uracil-DNA glycosylase
MKFEGTSQTKFEGFEEPPTRVERFNGWKEFFEQTNDLLASIFETLETLEPVNNPGKPPLSGGSGSQGFRPSKQDVMRIFKVVRPENVRAVIVGQSPYPNYHACGIPFMSSVNGVPKTLEVIVQELKKEYNVSWEMQPNETIVQWIEQGVFILNIALTVPIDPEAIDHLVLWEEFSRKVIRYITTINQNVPVLLFGKDAWRLENDVCSPSVAFKVPHPVSRTPDTFIGCNVFKKANNFLMNKKLTPIMWV